MPLHWTFRQGHNKSYRFEWRMLWLGIVLTTSCPVRAEILVNASEAIESAQSIADSVVVIGFGVAGAAHAVGPDTLLHSASETSEPQAGKILKEVGKQTIDQPGHFLIAAAPIWASRYLVGVPWYGWVATPLLAYREWLQWPSNRWWDPPLDWAFLSLGAIVATCRRRSRHRLNGLRPLPRRIARGLSLPWRGGDMTPDLGHARAGLPSGTARRRRSLSAAARAGCRR